MKTRIFSILSLCALMIVSATSYADVSHDGFSVISMTDVAAVDNHKHVPGCNHSMAEDVKAYSHNTDSDTFAIYSVFRKQVVAGAKYYSCASQSNNESPVSNGACAACHHPPDAGVV